MVAFGHQTLDIPVNMMEFCHLQYVMQVFFIKYTKEVFKSYESYIYKVNQYLKPIWSCAYTGKGNLTYEDALEEEEKALKSLDKVRILASCDLLNSR